MFKQGILRVSPPSAVPPTWVHRSPAWLSPEVSDPAAAVDLLPAWRHVWARMIGGRDAPLQLESASFGLGEETGSTLLNQLGWCSAEWVRPPPDGKPAIGHAACGVEEVAATAAAYQLAAIAATSPAARQQLVQTVLSGGHAAYHAAYALAALPSMVAGAVIDELLDGLDAVDEVLDTQVANVAVAHSVFVLAEMAEALAEGARATGIPDALAAVQALAAVAKDSSCWDVAQRSALLGLTYAGAAAAVAGCIGSSAAAPGWQRVAAAAEAALQAATEVEAVGPDRHSGSHHDLGMLGLHTIASARTPFNALNPPDLLRLPADKATGYRFALQ